MNEMETYITAGGMIVLLIAVIIAMQLRYRRMLKRKDEGIYHRIREEQRLAEELQRARIAQETIQNVLDAQLRHTPPTTADGLEKEIILLVKARKIGESNNKQIGNF
jgi:hypothetical protein